MTTETPKSPASKALSQPPVGQNALAAMFHKPSAPGGAETAAPKRKARGNPAVREFILDNIERHPNGIAKIAAEALGITPVSARRYLNALVSEGLLTAEGTTKARKYKLRNFVEELIHLDIDPNFEEHIAWRKHVAPALGDLPKNIREICEYGVSEMLNNVKDHSTSEKAEVAVIRNARHVEIVIHDFGIGIFKKIADACGLSDYREAILELSKGKLTTAPDRHTGEGIFFTSRMFTEFILSANNLGFTHFIKGGGDWLMEVGHLAESVGTTVYLRMSLKETHTIRDIFGKYEQDDDGYLSFSKTHVPVRLALYDNEQLVSRSQARRVLARFNKFSEVILDFSDVPMIGQAFADEIFRVYKLEHPEVTILPINADKLVYNTIRRAAPETIVLEPAPEEA
jgi:anti-sigma regulatory factor (Ser/Thr protein kinase)